MASSSFFSSFIFPTSTLDKLTFAFEAFGGILLEEEESVQFPGSHFPCPQSAVFFGVFGILLEDDDDDDDDDGDDDDDDDGAKMGWGWLN